MATSAFSLGGVSPSQAATNLNNGLRSIPSSTSFSEAPTTNTILPPPLPTPDYNTLMNQNGTIISRVTGRRFSSNQDLASYLGIQPNQIDWTKIETSPQAIQPQNIGNKAKAPQNNLPAYNNTLPSAQSAPTNPINGALNVPATNDPTLPKATAPKSITQTPLSANSFQQNVANIAGTAKNSAVNGYVKNLANTANNPGVQTAYQNLQELENEYANKGADIAGTPTDLSLAGGRQGILNQLFAAKQAAAQTAIQNAITEQQTKQSAYNQAASQGIQEQQTAQGAYEKAAGLLAPVPGVAYGTQTFIPQNAGQPTGSTEPVSPSDPFYAQMQTYASALVNNQPASIPSSVSGNPALMAQLLTMAQQINPSFNFNTAAGIGAAQQSNAEMGGTASVSANQNVYNNALSTLTQYQQMAANIKSFGDQLVSNMQTAGINPSSAQYANMTLNELQTQFSNSGYAVFNANIQGLQARVASLLQTGEIPTSATGAAQQVINGNISLSAMQATLQQINNEADAIVSNQSKIAQTAYGNIQNNASASTTAGNVGNPGSSSGTGLYNW